MRWVCAVCVSPGGRSSSSRRRSSSSSVRGERREEVELRHVLNKLDLEKGGRPAPLGLLTLLGFSSTRRCVSEQTHTTVRWADEPIAGRRRGRIRRRRRGKVFISLCFLTSNRFAWRENSIGRKLIGSHRSNLHRHRRRIPASSFKRNKPWHGCNFHVGLHRGILRRARFNTDECEYLSQQDAQLLTPHCTLSTSSLSFHFSTLYNSLWSSVCSRYVAVHVELTPGSFLFSCTCGFIEWCNFANDLFGRFENIVQSSVKEPNSFYMIQYLR